MSTSRLTREPGTRAFNVVTATVCGIRLSDTMQPSVTSMTLLIVRLTPSTVTDPFKARYLASDSGALTSSSRLSATAS
jgi:hypothetical protein